MTKQNTLNTLLNSPCIFCDYDGVEYWQVGTHGEKCPFHKWGGKEEREDMLPDIIRKLHDKDIFSKKTFGKLNE